jgi:hypothetical protein
MRTVFLPPWCLVVALAGCVTHVPPQRIAWQTGVPTFAPQTAPSASAEPGYLRVETDTDRKEIGRSMYYDLRRPYDLYAEDGRLLRADVDNQDGRSGEEPALVPLPPGRYVVGTMVGTVYRKVQVEIRANARTDVPEADVRRGSLVFAAETPP